MFYSIISQSENISDLDISLGNNQTNNLNLNYNHNHNNAENIKIDDDLDEILNNENIYNFVKEKDTSLVGFINNQFDLNYVGNLNNEIMKKLNLELSNNQYINDKTSSNSLCANDSCTNVFCNSEICSNCNKIYCFKCLLNCQNCNSNICKECCLSFNMDLHNNINGNLNYKDTMNFNTHINVDYNEFYENSNSIISIESCSLCNN